jgi:hypothetical protein
MRAKAAFFRAEDDDASCIKTFTAGSLAPRIAKVLIAV